MNSIGFSNNGEKFYTKGTKFLTKRGYINIEDLNEVDLMVTDTFDYQSIDNYIRKLYTGNIYEITIKHHPNIINTTEDNMFYVREKHEILKDMKMSEVLSRPIWKKVKDLTYNDYFGMIINTQNNIPNFLINNINVKLDKLGYWFIMGYFLGNGWIKKSRGQETIRFNINISNEIEVIYKINSIIPIISKNVGNKSKTYISKNTLWLEIFKMFLNEKHEKHIPEWVQSTSNDYIKEFLNGFSKTDNCSIKNSLMEITTISINLAYGIQRLYLKLGLILNINVFINQKPSNKDLKVLIQKNIYIIKVDNIIRFYNAFIEDNYVWFAPLIIAKKVVSNIPIYNIEINNKYNFFVENTLVHN